MKLIILLLLALSLPLQAGYISKGGGGSSSTAWGDITGTLSSQTDLNSALALKAPLANPTFSGTITTPLTASKALVTGASSQLAVSAVTSTELGYVAGVSSAIQTQLGTKLPLAGGTMTGDITFSGSHTIFSLDQLNVNDIWNGGHNQNYLSFFGGTTYIRGTFQWRDDNSTDVGVSGGRPRDWFGAGAIASGVQKSIPATGDSVTISAHKSSLIIVPAGTIATLSVTMPAAPIDGQVVHIACTQIVTTLTLSGNSGQTVDGALTAFAANGFATYQYVLADTTWYRIG